MVRLFLQQCGYERIMHDSFSKVRLKTYTHVRALWDCLWRSLARIETNFRERYSRNPLTKNYLEKSPNWIFLEIR